MRKSTTIDGNITGVGVAHDSTINQTIIQNNHYEIPKQLTTKLGKSTLIGREKELKEIDEQLKASKTFLVKGIGGIGKSTIVSNYLHRHKDEYDYYGFFEGLESFESQLELAFKIEIEQGQDRLDRILRELIKLDGNKLLVIDDVKEIKDNQEKLEKILGLEHNRYRVLLTSREEIENVTKYDLDILSMDDAKELFNSISEVKDEQLLEEILEYLDCHAFFVEKTAHSIKKTLTPEMIRDKFNNGKFSKISVKRKENFNKFLNELFTLDGLDDEEILMLKQLSVLPSVEIEFKFLEGIFDKKNDREFEDLLTYLCAKGWLSSFENEYKLHQILKEYILENHLPKFYEIKKIFDAINKKTSLEIEYILSFYFVMELIEKKKIPFLSFLLKFFKFSVIEKFIFIKKFIIIENSYNKKMLYNEIITVFNFFDSIASIYFYQGEYQKSLETYLKYKKQYIKVLGEVFYYSNDKYETLAEIYEKLNKKESELNLYKKALEIRKKHCGQKCLRVASTYHALAVYYRKNENYQKSVEYFNKSLEIKINELGEEDSSIAFTYNSLGVLYSSMNDNKQALKMYQKSLRLYDKIEESLNKALVYFNLGVYYISCDYKKAYRFLNKSLEIRKELLDIADDTIYSYKGLASFYFELNRFKDSYYMMNKAIEMLEYMYLNLDDHPDLIEAKEELKMIKKELEND